MRPDQTLPAAFFTAWQPTTPVTTTTQPLAVFGDELALLDYTVGT
jgi:hypothetical protein